MRVLGLLGVADISLHRGRIVGVRVEVGGGELWSRRWGTLFYLKGG